VSLRADVERCFRAALAACDPEPLVRDALARAPELAAPGGRVRVLAAGKAAAAMARGAAAALEGRAFTGLVVTPTPDPAPAGMLAVVAAHPLPDERSVAAARAAQALARDGVAGDVLVVLLSGGASSLLALPHSAVPLPDYAETVRLLMHAGADIHALNTVRRALDHLKGGGLAAAADPADIVAFAISDVPGDDPAAIASGPLHPDPTTAADAIEVLRAHGVLDAAPAAVRSFLDLLTEAALPAPRLLEARRGSIRYELVATSATAVRAAAAEAGRLGYDVTVDAAPVQGGAAEVGAAWGRRARTLAGHAGGPAAHLAGGETTVTVRGSGRGGRNQEVALAAALEMDGLADVAFGALATDGIDGPTDAAGAIVDGGVAAALRARGVDGRAALRDNDAYAALDAVGALLRTGATGTNVMDLCLLLARPAPAPPRNATAASAGSGR
jgi:glycerate 2-kinase